MRRRTGGTAVLILIAFATWGSLGFFAGYEEQTERSYTLEDGASLAVRGRNGEIAFETWNGGEVVILATVRTRALTTGLARSYARRWGVEFSREDDGVRAESATHPLPFLGSISVDYRIKVPEGWTGRITLHTSNGRIRAEQVHGDVDLHSSNGVITVRGHSGTMRARTSNGRIALADIDTDLDAETSNGRIEVHRGVLRGEGHIRTSNGGLELDVHLEPGATYEARTSNGAVTVALADPDVALELTTSNGPINLQTEIIATHVSRNRVVGRIGEGAARLVARTSNGAISLAGRFDRH